MIPGDIGDLRALARLAQDLLHDVVVRLGPVPSAFQLPAVDNIADEIEIFRLIVAQEIEQVFSLASGCAEMNVGNPNGSVSPLGSQCGMFCVQPGSPV